jgi:hypothetical protein
MAKFKYKKFAILLTTYILALIIFRGPIAEVVKSGVLQLNYFGAFVAGIMFAYSFTAGFATAIFLVLGGENNFWLTGLIGGLGALTGDFIIFKMMRGAFKDELKKMGQEKIFQIFANNKKVATLTRKYILPIVGALVIASPLPDEIGVTMLASDRLINSRIFSILSYALNTAGIFVILFIGK